METEQDKQRVRDEVWGRLDRLGAVPKLADVQPFYRLDPAIVGDDSATVAVSAGAAAHAPKVGIHQMRPVDLVICGSVAVNRDGARVGKGAGYADIEVALLVEAGLIGPETILATTVHAAQVLDRPLPESPPRRQTRPHRDLGRGDPVRVVPPSGRDLLDALDAGKVDAIPVLALDPRRPT